MKRFFVPFMTALAGIASLALLFPRFDPSASLHAILSRDQAIAKTRQLAASKGVNAATWKAAAIESLDTPTGPLKIQVALMAPHKGGDFQAAWFPNGTLAWSSLPGQEEPFSVGAIHIDAAGPSDSGKVRVNIGENALAGEKLSYMALRIIDTLWRVLVVVYFAVAIFRRRLRYRIAFALAAIVLVWALASFWGGTSYEKTRIVKASVDTMKADGAGDINVNVGGSSQSNTPSRGSAVFWIFLFGAAGIAVRGLDNHRKWHAVELLAQRRILSRPVGWAVATGLLSGIGIAAIPYWIAASAVFPGSTLVFRSVDTLAAPFPALAAWDLSIGVVAAGIFGLTAPLLARLRQPFLRWGLLAIVAIPAIGHAITPFSTQGANLFAAVALFSAFLLVYVKTDLLATITAVVAARAAIAPCVLLAQPDGPVRALAVPLLLIWGAALAVSVHFALRGTETEELPVTPPLLDPVEEPTGKTGRLRLEAEFDVARKAQEDALPRTSPAVPGYTIAGSCEPAQQVGGDLFDYFPLSDGRVGIAVADVSGKGVPAALYMMVTKGLLAAITRDSCDLAYIFQQINKHLYRACKKKVFVTLAAVALDPPARRLQHGRAGHNPIVWRRAGRGETVILKPPGVGLGMTPGERFNRALKIEELQLEEGDAVVLYSDGITEAMDRALQQFGEVRLIRAVEATDGQAAEATRSAILRDLAAFTNGAPARDDVTLVVLRVAETGVLT